MLGMGAALLSNLIFGFSFLFAKTALGAAHPLIILSVRFSVAFIVMSLLILLGAVKVSFRGKNIKGLALMSVAQPLLYFIFELYGISMCSSALSGIIIGLVPVGVIILSRLFLSEKPTLTQVICTAVSIIGVGAVSILSNDGEQNKLLGIILLVGAVISASVFNILSRGEAKSFSAFERTYFMFAVAFVGFNLIALSVLKGDYFVGLKNAFSSLDFIISVGYLSILSSIGAFMLYNYSTSKISAVRAASFSNIITVVSLFAGIVILKEQFSIWQILLTVPIILGVLGVNTRFEK